MTQRYFYRHLFMVIAALLVLAFGSCQRSNYSFQPDYGNVRAGLAARTSPIKNSAIREEIIGLSQPNAARGSAPGAIVVAAHTAALLSWQ